MLLRNTLNTLTRGQKLTLINKITRETFDSESDKIKREILLALEQLREEIAEAAQRGERTPEEYLDAIDAVPALLDRLLNEVALQTGWWFTVIGGGPDPADNGNIRTGSFHVGQNAHKRNFEDEYTHFSVDPKDTHACRSTFDENVIAPYGRFLKSLFSPEIRAQRACNQADLQALKATFNSEEQEPSPGSPAVPSPAAPPLPPSSSILPSSTGSNCTDPQITLSTPVMGTTPTPGAGLDSELSNEGNPHMSRVDTAKVIESTATDDLEAPDSGGLEPDVFNDAGFGHSYYMMRSTEQDRFEYDLLLGRAGFAREDEDEGFPFMDGICLERNGADLSFTPQSFQLPLDQSLQRELPLLPHWYQRDEHDDRGSDEESSQPVTMLSHDIDSTTLPAVPNAIKDQRQNADGNDKRRKHHAIEAMEGSEGLSTITPDGNKEDSEVRTSKRARKPAAPRQAIAVGWLPSAVQYLTDNALGSEWMDLLVSWQALEARMSLSQAGSPGKGWMGAIASRPATLSVWLSNRRYNVYPGLPTSFSTELLTWWNAMQPDWRRSETGPLPMKNYCRPLDKALRKGGQNGIVTVLIGLMWWGQGTLPAEEAALWKAMVADVHACIKAMMPCFVEA
ncbi:uncharacterized protein ARMOST_22083 [Armillaria ostoyae]|uniref:Uncharacterized protein n=1 Tax=Armillaria ostoyae TaxID=47428 RepID=A0A284SBW0_ARMOS|nr:uncharacterized protein ARMOST_22083 [Armillaria ostoyae]